ncbi:MAG: ATP-binding protein, partial [Romboutsia sp.]|nr:ATP-binding protein [Romboutsia sp.]
EPLKSGVIELVSNAQDSMIEAGKLHDPIFLIKENGHVTIKDTGLGMSPEFMDEKYIDFGHSSKERSEYTTGHFGIGRLAILGYVNNYTVTSYYEGMKRVYLITSDDNDTPGKSLLIEEPTEEINGVEVTFRLDSKDNTLLESVITERLMFFPNLILKGSFYINNNYKIFDYKNFKFCGRNASLNILHGYNVYPVNWSYFKEFSYFKYIPLSLSFDITDPIEPVPSRTELKWDNKTIELIKNKFVLVEQELKDIMFSQLKRTSSFPEWCINSYHSFKLGDRNITSLEKSEFFYTGDIDKNMLSEYRKMWSTFYYIDEAENILDLREKDKVFLSQKKDHLKYRRSFRDLKFLRLRHTKGYPENLRSYRYSS